MDTRFTRRHAERRQRPHRSLGARVLRGTLRGSTALCLALAGGVAAGTAAQAPSASGPTASAAPLPVPQALVQLNGAPAPRQLPAEGVVPAQATVRARHISDAPGTPLEKSVFRRDPAGPLYLVNKRWEVPRTYAPAQLVPLVGSAERMRPEAAAAWAGLVGAARKDGVSLTVISAFRSFDEQQRIRANLSGTLGEQRAARLSAPPGHSEHQLGLALDVVGADDACHLEACFAGTKEGKWLAAHAAEHGFLIRYPVGAEARTGYSPEPWHLRYLGPEVTQDIRSRGIATYEDWVATELLDAPVS